MKLRLFPQSRTKDKVNKVIKFKKITESIEENPHPNKRSFRNREWGKQRGKKSKK